MKYLERVTLDCAKKLMEDLQTQSKEVQDGKRERVAMKTDIIFQAIKDALHPALHAVDAIANIPLLDRNNKELAGAVHFARDALKIIHAEVIPPSIPEEMQ